MNKILAIIILMLLAGCGENIKARKHNLRFIEPGTIAYRYEAMGITIDETKLAIEGFQERKTEITGCFGEDGYQQIELEIQKKLKFLEGERPYYITKLFMGSAPVWSPPKHYNSQKIDSIIEALGHCLAQKSKATIPSAGTAKAGTPDNGSTATTLGAENQVRVPDLTSSCPENPEKVLEALGLKSNREDIHGPIDSDAASIGCPYRQKPAAGTLVNKGATVSYRSWWEAS